jgi:type I restriction enzyme S subunit
MHVDGHVTILHPDSSKCDPVIFGYAMLASQPELEALGEGSTGQTELGRERLASLVVDIPTPENCEVVSPQLSLLDRVAGQLYEETQYLLALREALLPTLISGELRVNDTKALVEEPA